MKKIVMLFLLTTVIWGNAQEFQGKAYYFSKTSVDANFGGRQMSEDQKKAITERLKSASEKTFILTFNKEASAYKQESQLEESGNSGRWGAMMSGFTSNNYYKNIIDKVYYDQREFYGKNFLIQDSIQQYKWTMLNETKQIGNYTCFKAVTTKIISDVADWRSIRRKARELRNKGEEESKDVTTKTDSSASKEIEVVAWYTPEIPINQGPGEFWGLPGLILEVQQGRNTLLCNKIVLNTKDDLIKIPTKGKKVSQDEFDNVSKKKIEEMIEQFSTRRRGGFGGRRN
ncbi:GLPGLI family protein [Aquimarina sp. AU474]|uniref:GLPGLI family protein n=1 Tax=Aquimarina sp. AU474 TaxID=2108529 RepID=UPI000D688505|nr:GLPGLI family protein [Aquimarina sp. AU474]